MIDYLPAAGLKSLQADSFRREVKVKQGQNRGLLFEGFYGSGKGQRLKKNFNNMLFCSVKVN